MAKDEINQTKCWIATEGSMWMNGYFQLLAGAGAAATTSLTVQPMSRVPGDGVPAADTDKAPRVLV